MVVGKEDELEFTNSGQAFEADIDAITDVEEGINEVDEEE